MSDDCVRSREIEALFDRRLEVSASERANEHLAGCEACRVAWARLEELRARLRDSLEAPNAFAMKRVRRQVLDGVSATRRTRRWRWSHALVPLLGVLLAAVTVILWGRPPRVMDLTLTATPGARFVREANDAFDIVRLTDGEFDFDVHAHASGKRLLVVVPEGEIEDIGTRFRVVVDEGATREITVSEGEVEFRREGMPPLRLVAGMSYRPRGSVAVEPTSMASTRSPSPSAPTSAAPPTSVAHPHPRATEIATSRQALASPQAIASSTSAAGEDGATREDIAYMNVIRLMRAGREDEARSLARRYLDDFPTGLRRTEMAALAHPRP